MYIYVASSWRNEFQDIVVTVLKSAGHEVYDFRNPELMYKMVDKLFFGSHSFHPFMTWLGG